MAKHLKHFAVYFVLCFSFTYPEPIETTAQMDNETYVNGNTNLTYMKNFIRVQNALIGYSGMERLYTTFSNCSYRCFDEQRCNSFTYNYVSSYCKTSSYSTQRSRTYFHSDTDYYEKKRNYEEAGRCPLNIIYGTTISGYESLPVKELPFPECLAACYDNSSCNSILYNPYYRKCIISQTNTNNNTLIYRSLWQHIDVNRTHLLSIPRHQLTSSIESGCDPSALQRYYFPDNLKANSLLKSAEYTEQWNRYNYIVSDEFPLVSKIECAAKCLVQEGCVGYFYNPSSCNLASGY